MNNSPIILVPISLGELFDKITILQIKKSIIKGSGLKNINKELYYLEKVVRNNKLSIDIDIFNYLKKINRTLWDIEDKIRIKESNNEFDDEFIQLARKVYFTNDTSASIKKYINILFESEVIEV